MKLLKSFLVLAAVIALGIVVYVKVYRVENENQARDVDKGKLVQFNIDGIKKFTLVRPDSSISFERVTGSIWNITAPVKAEAEGKSLYTLFNLLASSDVLYDVDDKPKDLGPYGLSHSLYYMAMEYDKGKPDTLFVGNDTPDKTMTYVKFASSRKVLAVSNALTTIMKQPIRYYRARTVLNIVGSNVRALEIFRGKDDSDRISMMHDGISWVMQYPWSFPGDPKDMEELLQQLSESTKKSLEAERTTNLSRYGLDNPSYVINVSLGQGLPDKTLLIGNRLTEKGKKQLWYAKQLDNDLVFTVQNSFVTMLGRTPVWFIDRQPVKFDRNIVTKIILRSGREDIVFSRDTAGGWSVISPVDKNVSEHVPSLLLSVSRFMMVSDVLSVNPTPKDLAKAGIDHPKFVLTFYSSNQMLAKVEYGKSYTGGTIMTYVRTSLSPTVYITGSPVDASIKDVLEKVYGK